MSEAKKQLNSCSPFTLRIDAPAKSGFDKYYIDAEYKEVFKKTGIDVDGEEIGVIDLKCIISKRDIAEFINSQADSVGVQAYMRALAVQGVSLDECNTAVEDKVVDYSQFPESLADVMTSGDKAIKAFENLDPALKGSHTTIEGFLNSLSQESIDAYIKGKVDAAFPKVTETGGAK